MGPFYCPPDQRVYLDLSFFEDLRRMGAPGDFGRAYVIAHEVGHHVQNLLGIEGREQVLRSQVADRASADAISVLTELQADCYAGIWAHHANAHDRSNKQRPLIVPGDIDSGFAAAASVGRRPPPAPGDGSGSTGIVHPRLLGAAGELVQDGPGDRRPPELRHLRQGRSAPLTAGASLL